MEPNNQLKSAAEEIISEDPSVQIAVGKEIGKYSFTYEAPVWSKE